MKKIALVFLLLLVAISVWVLRGSSLDSSISTPDETSPIEAVDEPENVTPVPAQSIINVKEGWGYYISFRDQSTGKLMNDVSSQRSWKKNGETKTMDSDGSMSAGFVEVNKDLHEFTLKFSHPTHYSEQRSYTVSLSEEEPMANVEVLMIPGETISGRVYDSATNEGIAGVKVGVGRRKSPGAVTDDSGHYRIEGVRSGRKQIFLDHAKGYIDPPSMRNGSLVEVSKGQALTGVDFALEKGVFASIQGRVVDAEGNAVSGAKVSTISYDDTMTDYQSAEDVSAKDGSYVLEELQVDDGFYVTATTKGFISEELGPLSLSAEGIEDLELKLISTGSISGQVVDVNTGKAVPEPSFQVKMLYAWRGQNIAGGHPSNLSKDGSFTISELPPGQYGLYLDTHPNTFQTGWIKSQVEVELGVGEHMQDVKLTYDYDAYLKAKMARETTRVNQPSAQQPKPPTFPELKGQVLRAGTSDPVTAFDLKIMHKNMEETRSQRSIQDPNGRFTIREEQGHTLTLAISAKGYAPTSVRYTLDNPSEFKDPVIIALEPGAELEGHVLDTEGNGIAGAKVYIDFNPTLMETGGFSHPADATSGADGAFKLNTLTDSTTRIYAQHPTYAVGFDDIRPTREHSTTLDIVLNEGGVIEGVVSLRGEPIPDYRIMALNDAGTNIEIENNRTDEHGRYRITRLTPGEYTVYTNVDNFSRTVKVFAEVAEGMVTEADILFGDTPHSLSGSVTLNGEVPWSLSIQANVQSDKGLETISARSKDSSAYLIENLPAGEAAFTVYASLRDGTQGKDTFTLGIEDGSYTQDLQLTSE